MVEPKVTIIPGGRASGEEVRVGRGGAVPPHAGDLLSRKDVGPATPSFLRVAGGVGVLLLSRIKAHSAPFES